jgi:hypothetical protein
MARSDVGGAVIRKQDDAMSEFAQLPVRMGLRARLLAGIFLVSLTLSACTASSVPLTPTDAALLRRAPSEYGTLVYRGEVTPYGREVAVLRYQRWVQEEGDGLVRSTHVTLPRDRAEPPFLVQRATHDKDYRLVRFEQISGQVGAKSAIEVRADGSIAYKVQRGENVETNVEPPGLPLVVGPTLFAWVRLHLDTLRAGERLKVRFAVAEKARSYELALRAKPSGAHATTVMLEPTELFVSLALDPMRIEFDDRATVTSYHGRVPALLEGHAFDAHVTYAYETSFR